MVGCAFDPRSEFQASQSYTVRLCQKQTKKHPQDSHQDLKISESGVYTVCNSQPITAYTKEYQNEYSALHH